ncbi:bifunctional Quinoprotein alcohol dehydrogenase-like superfamily/Protein kinase domain/Protein kinase-like domain superfamily/Protein kinase [Babesia duncani]|uniref:non-specific serine/threonine protein kinase n=1 Tax=Babesia duncani TaxID=323732 RepID=A0AAD9PMY9_9APIC|nr:bifunctional Quinoprotein alcohol dehydrogenase-like superfamily/Protein kinase domain/Protein kinase-like domain superfamily/Protein kinase [Babesia duncani]
MILHWFLIRKNNNTPFKQVKLYDEGYVISRIVRGLLVNCFSFIKTAVNCSFCWLLLCLVLIACVNAQVVDTTSTNVGAVYSKGDKEVNMSLVRHYQDLSSVIGNDTALLVLDTEGLAYRIEFNGSIYWVTRLTEDILTVKKPSAERENTCAIDDLDTAKILSASTGEFKYYNNKLLFQRHLVPSYDGYVYYVDETHNSTLLQVHTRDIVNFTPFRTPLLEGVYLEGSRNSSVLALDYETGDYLMRHSKRKVPPQRNLSFFNFFFPKQGVPKRQLHVGYTDWTVRAFDEKCHTELWSFTWREIGSVNNETGDTKLLEKVRNMIRSNGNKLSIRVPNGETYYENELQFPFPIAAVFAVMVDTDGDLMNMQLITRVSIPPPNSFLQMSFTKPLATLELSSSMYHSQKALSVRNGIINLTSGTDVMDREGIMDSVILPLKRVDDWYNLPQRDTSLWERWWISILWVFALALVPFIWLMKRMRRGPYSLVDWTIFEEEDEDLVSTPSAQQTPKDFRDSPKYQKMIEDIDGEPWHESVIPKSSKLSKFLENGKFYKYYKSMQLLGRGGFGAVYRVQHTLEPGDPEYAVKLVLLRAKDGEDLTKRRYFREITANVQVFSRSIVRYFTWWFEEPHFLPLGPLTAEVQAAAAANILELKRRGCAISDANKILMGFLSGDGTCSQKNTLDLDGIDDRYPSFSKIAPNSKPESTFGSRVKPQWTESEQLSIHDNSNTVQKWHQDQKHGPKTYPLVLIMTMEMVHGVTLRQWLNNPKRSIEPLEFLKHPNPIEFIFFRHLMEGIELIHHENFIHRDLKPENIFVDEKSPSLKIGDFGLVGFIEHPDELGEESAQSAKGHLFTDSVQDGRKFIGTPGYAAPESGVSCTPKVDIYSCALILLELLCPRFETVMERLSVLEKFRRTRAIPEYLASEPRLEFWCTLMRRMIDKNPNNRPTSPEIIAMLKQHG